MAHTHTFEINTEHTGLMEGELSYNGDKPPHIMITSPIDTDVSDLKKVIEFINSSVVLCKEVGEIISIEINKKT